MDIYTALTKQMEHENKLYAEIAAQLKALAAGQRGMLELLRYLAHSEEGK